MFEFFSCNFQFDAKKKGSDQKISFKKTGGGDPVPALPVQTSRILGIASKQTDIG